MTRAEANANEYLRAYFELNAQYEVYAKSLGISYSTLSTLRIILEHDGDYTQGTVCGYTFLPKQTVSAIVTALLRHETIRTIRLDSDRRHKVIHLTDKRWASALEVIQKMKNAESKAIESLDKNQKGTMLTTTELYVARFRGYLLEQSS